MRYYIVDGDDLTSLASKIRTKGGTSESLSWPDGFENAIDNIDTGASGGGGGSVTRKDVNFYDYDGSIVESYTTAEFANISALPANPTHTGLTAQGWNMPANWTLADAKTYIATNKKADWGQMYITDDGKTRVYIHLEEGRTSPRLGCCPNGTVDVDWGDGTTHDTLTGTSTSTVKWTSAHAYAAPGDYVIKLTVTGSMGLYGSLSSNQYCGLLRYSSSADTRNKTYQGAIQRVEIGTGVTSIGSSAFYNCYNLTSVTIPSSIKNINTYAFYSCYSLSSVTIPSSIKSIGTYAFQYCYSLTSITIPSGVTSISNSAFLNCSSLFNVIIQSGVTSIGGSTFQNCYSLTSVTIPSSVTSIGNNAFQNCYGLTSATIPSGVMDIGSSAFQGCFGMSSVTIPSSVTSIGASAFNSCTGLGAIHFKPETPPTVSNINAWTSLPTDCKIYVPTGKLSSYTGASYYPSSSTYTYIEE